MKPKTNKIIDGDLILKKNTTYNCNLIVKGNIRCEGGRWDLTCGDLTCWDLTCRDLDCGDLDCGNLDCRDLTCGSLNCWNLDCMDLDCWDVDCQNIVLCETVKIKDEGKIKAKAFFQNRLKMEQKEWKGLKNERL